jgi:hypothetical protein
MLLRLVFVCSAVVLFTAATPAGVVAAPRPQPDNGLRQLWSRFPLAPKPDTVVTTGSVKARTSVPAHEARSNQPRAPQTHGSHISALWLLPAAVCALIVCAFAWTWTRAQRGFEKTSTGGSSGMVLRRKDQEAVEHRAAERSAPGNEVQDASEGAVSEQSVADHVKQYLGAPSQGKSDAAEVGGHIAAVLVAAESAAEQLREEAERSAQRTQQEAEEAAEEIRARAVAEAEAQTGEARRQSAAWQEEARAARADADRYAETRAREADEAATRLLRDAENRASEFAEAAAERHGMLLDDITTCETRIQQMAVSLREVADRLDAVADAGVDSVLDRELVWRVSDEAKGGSGK